jgi:hypothetical protein
MPAAIHRFFIEPSFHRVTRPVVRRATEIMDSIVILSFPPGSRSDPTSAAQN